jgi:hypothetical protein
LIAIDTPLEHPFSVPVVAVAGQPDRGRHQCNTRSPLRGLATQCVLNRLHGTKKYLEQITVEPQLIVRESTQAIQQKNPAPRGKKGKVSR